MATPFDSCMHSGMPSSHAGHIKAFGNALKHGTRLFVGVCSDEDVMAYKRAPVMTEVLVHFGARIRACLLRPVLPCPRVRLHAHMRLCSTG